jgi:beta-glucosidase
MNVGFKQRVALGVALIFCLMSASQSHGQFGPQKREPKGPWENKNLSADERADLVIEKMTLDEKIQLLHGLGWDTIFTPPESGPGTRAITPFEFIPGVPRLGIPDLQMTDAVVGVSGAGIKSRYATALPSAVAMAAGWDPALSYEIGTLIGNEVRAHGFNMSLGSGINLTREAARRPHFRVQGRGSAARRNISRAGTEGHEGTEPGHRREALRGERSGRWTHVCELRNRQARDAGERPACI